MPLTLNLNTVIIILSLICCILYIRHLQGVIVHTKISTMNIVGRDFAERRRLQAKQQTRNISRAIWNAGGTRTGEKEDRSQKKEA